MNGYDIPIFVKWAGGKSQLLPQFEAFFPESFDGYYEPFLGGGAVFYYVKQRYSPERIVLSDSNKTLVDCYVNVRDSVDDLIELLRVHQDKHSKDYYYQIRDLFNSRPGGVEESSMFLYLNKTCFNGLYRENSKGGFNVPFGRYKNPNIVNEKVLRKANELLQGVEIQLMDFEEVEDMASGRDLVYFDPPYHPLSETSSFTSYTKGVFSEKEQIRLSDLYRRLDDKDTKLKLSNSDTPLIRKIFDGYNINVVTARRSINCKGNGRGKINELLILNYIPNN
jgi:DNA adenine methylase